MILKSEVEIKKTSQDTQKKHIAYTHIIFDSQFR